MNLTELDIDSSRFSQLSFPWLRSVDILKRVDLFPYLLLQESLYEDCNNTVVATSFLKLISPIQYSKL